MAGWYVFMWVITSCSVAALCAVAGLSIWSFHAWRREYRRWARLYAESEKRARRAENAIRMKEGR